MSAVVCGSKRSFFEEIPSTTSVSKRIRCSSPSTSPTRLAPLDRLRSLFPHMEDQVLERVLEDCGNNLEAAIKSLEKLCLTPTEKVLANANEPVAPVAQVQAGFANSEVANGAGQKSAVSENLPSSGAEWVDYLVREMTTATSIDDAKARAGRVLEILEKTISGRAGEEAAKSFQQENMMLKEQIQILIKDNSLLKRAVALQHERQKDYEDMNREIEHLKQVVSQYQEQVRTLEVNNYALRMHLRQAQDGNSFPGRFHPDVF